MAKFKMVGEMSESLISLGNVVAEAQSQYFSEWLLYLYVWCCRASKFYYETGTVIQIDEWATIPEKLTNKLSKYRQLTQDQKQMLIEIRKFSKELYGVEIVTP
jgi:hypothetical protein